MADYLPKFNSGKPFTLASSADVIGGRVLVASGAGTVATAGADAANVVGVAAFDALSGEPVTIFPRSGGVQQLVASAAIAAGALVISAAAGKIATVGTGVNPIGIALTAATADLDVVDVLFI